MSINRGPDPESNSHELPPAVMRGRRRVIRKGVTSLPGPAVLAKALWIGFTRQHAAFMVACVYLIFEYNRPQLIWPILDVLPWGAILILCGLSLAAADPLSRRPRAGVIVFLSAFALSMTLSTAFAFHPGIALSKWQVWLSWILVVVLLTSVVSTRERVLLFVFVYYLVNLKMAQHGFRTWAGRGFGTSSWGVTGSPGWFQNSGEFGMQMAMLVPLLVAHIMAVRDRFDRRVLIVAALFLVIVVGATIASNSRGALLGLAVGALWLIISSRRRITALIVTAIATAAVIAAIPPETMQRFDTAGEDLTSQSRLEYWQYGIDTVRENPLLRVGFQNWVPYVSHVHPEAFATVGRIEAIHSTYLQVATELGLLGLTIYVAALFYVFWLNLTTAIRANAAGDALLSATATGLNGGLAVYLVTSFFMSVFLYPFLWVMLALSAACASVARDTSDPGSTADANRRVAYPRLVARQRLRAEDAEEHQTVRSKSPDAAASGD